MAKSYLLSRKTGCSKTTVAQQLQLFKCIGHCFTTVTIIWMYQSLFYDDYDHLNVSAIVVRQLQSFECIGHCCTTNTIIWMYRSLLYDSCNHLNISVTLLCFHAFNASGVYNVSLRNGSNPGLITIQVRPSLGVAK